MATWTQLAFWVMIPFVLKNMTFTGFVGVIVSLIGLFLLNLYVNQEKMLYHPIAATENPPGYREPSEHDLPHEDVYLTTSDGHKLHAWMIKQPNAASCPTWLFFHANAGNMGIRLPNIKQYYQGLQVNVFILSYRGYGNSEGIPSESGLILDAETAWAHLMQRTDIDTNRIIVFGRSLGGAVAIALTQKYDKQISCLIIENTFTCIADMVDKLFPFIKHLKKWMLRLDWSSFKRIGTITTPILFLSGAQDEVVPATHMQTLYQLATQSKGKEIQIFRDGHHNDTWLVDPRYIEIIRAFLVKNKVIFD